jgi:sugar-specific transcriptional regulator TrmB
LKHFGFSGRESLTYIEVLHMGATSIQDLSNKLKRNRITVYYTVQQLIEKGLLFEQRKGKKRLISAEKPEILFTLLERRQRELTSIENNLGHITNLLNSVRSPHHQLTMVKVYEDVEGFKRMLEETLETKGELLVFSSREMFSSLLGESYLESYFKRRVAHGISTRIIYPPCPFAALVDAKKEEYKIELRILIQDQRYESGFYVWNDTVAIKSLREEQRSCTLIENKDIANFFRNNIFEHFWGEAAPYDPKNF